MLSLLFSKRLSAPDVDTLVFKHDNYCLEFKFWARNQWPDDNEKSMTLHKTPV